MSKSTNVATPAINAFCWFWGWVSKCHLVRQCIPFYLFLLTGCSIIIPNYFKRLTFNQKKNALTRKVIDTSLSLIIYLFVQNKWQEIKKFSFAWTTLLLELCNLDFILVFNYGCCYLR